MVGLFVGEVGDAKPDAKNKSALSAGQDHRQAASRELTNHSCKASDSVTALARPAGTNSFAASVCAEGTSKPSFHCIWCRWDVACFHLFHPNLECYPTSIFHQN